ncbi:hypothetical protein AAFP35_22400 [Gordonia sp. CPCC 206044]|uniref:hypothetical protein n=1 Tax=Gordonia sp. CPCC 206044 TaxID=3140793 RepID=UPI003AF401D2
MTATTEHLYDTDGRIADQATSGTRGAVTMEIDTELVGDAASAPVDADSDPFCESVARLAASALDAPVAFVTVVESGAEIVKGAIDRERSRPATTTDIAGVVSRAERELQDGDGRVLGTLCVADRRERDWAEEDLAHLAQLSGLLATQLSERSAVPAQSSGSDLADDLDMLANSVHSLADLADRSDDVRLHRHAATSRRRLASVVEAAGTPAHRAETARQFDVRHAINRAVREASFVTGDDRIESVLGEKVLPIVGDQFAVERAVTHIVSAALDHTGSGVVRAELHVESDMAVFVVTSDDCTMSAGELARAVASVDKTRPSSAAAGIRLHGNETVVSGNGVRAASGPDGTTMSVRWAIANG